MGGNCPRGGVRARILGRMAVDTGVRRTARGAGWWLRTVATVVLPVLIGVAAWRRTGSAAVGLAVGFVALVGAVFVLHPDTLGWKLSLYGRMSAGPDTGPSHLWQVWARLFGVFLLVLCVIGVVLVAPSPPARESCGLGPDGTIVCP